MQHPCTQRQKHSQHSDRAPAELHCDAARSRSNVSFALTAYLLYRVWCASASLLAPRPAPLRSSSLLRAALSRFVAPVRSFSVAALNAQREGMLAANPGQDIPSPDGVERPNAKVTKIVDDIMQLNIFESIQLSKALQVRAAPATDGRTAGCSDSCVRILGGARCALLRARSCVSVLTIFLALALCVVPARAQKAMGLEGISIGMGGGGGGGGAPAAAAPAAAAKRKSSSSTHRARAHSVGRCQWTHMHRLRPDRPSHPIPVLALSFVSFCVACSR